MMDVQGLDIEWKNTATSLKDALDKCELPCVLQVSQKFVINATECIYDEERIVVHVVKTVAQLRGKDSEGKQATFAIACPFELKYSVADANKVYKTVGDLCAAQPVPKSVRMTGDVKGEEVKALQKEEKLKVLLTERNQQGPSFVHFRSETGKHLRLAVSFEGNFMSCPLDDNLHKLEDLATRELPIYVEFCPVNGKYPFEKKMGCITLTEGLTSEFIFATIKRKGKLAAFVLPLSSDLKVQSAVEVRNPQGSEVNLSQGVELPKFSVFLGRHRLENVLSGIIAPYDTLSVQLEPSSESRLASQTSEEDGKEKDADKTEVKKRDTEGSDKKSKGAKEKGMKEKAMRRMSKGKLLGKKKHKSTDRDSKAESMYENEAAPKGQDKPGRVEITVVEAHPDNASTAITPVTPVTPVQMDESCGEVEDMYLPPADLSSPSGVDASAPPPGVDVNAPPPELPVNTLEPPLYDDVCESNEASEDEYETPEGTGFQGPEEAYEAPIHMSPSPTMPRSGKDKGEKGIFSKMWKKMKKGATLPAMTPHQVKKLQKHIEADDIEVRGRSPSNISSPSPGPELIPTFDDEDLYEEIGDGFISSDIMKAAHAAHRFSFSTAPLPPKPSDSGDSGFGEDDLKELEKWRSNMPPELPGNHPMKPKNEKGGSIKFKNFCAGVKASEAEIRKWGLDEVEAALRKLLLKNYIDQFIDNQIDGPLLVDLDEAVFRDLGLGIFESRKLRKFVFGWRPDGMKGESYCGLKKSDSLDPTDWDESDVVEHLKTLALNDFATFCGKNQVNGDLLLDIVADDEVLSDVFKAGKLKSVKLKKYVLEGWRPQTKIYESRDTYEMPSPTDDKPQAVENGGKTQAAASNGSTDHVDGQKSSPSSQLKGATFPRQASTSGTTQTITLEGKVKQAKDTYLKQATRDGARSQQDRKPVKESPLIANIKQQLMEKSGTAGK